MIPFQNHYSPFRVNGPDSVALIPIHSVTVRAGMEDIEYIYNTRGYS